MSEERKALIEGFEKLYGARGQFLSEEVWLEWLGIFVLGWRQCELYYRNCSAEVASGVFENAANQQGHCRKWR